MSRMKRTAAAAAAFAIATAGLVTFGAGVASASPMIAVSQATGLVHNQQVDITVSGLSPAPEARITVSECANAYADNTPLTSIDSSVGSRDCEVLQFAVGFSSSTVVFHDVPIKQIGIGAGNRSCINSGGPAACFVYVSESVNQLGAHPSVDISFAADNPNASAAPTQTTVQLLGSPLGVSKTPVAYVQTRRVDAGVVPEGSFSVSMDGGSPLTVSTGPDGSAKVALDTPNSLSLGAHTLSATYSGNGSFASSSTGAQPVSIVGDKNITISDASVVATTTPGQKVLITFPIVLSKIPAVDLEVQYEITGVTAVAGTDYTPIAIPGGKGKAKFRGGFGTIKYATVKALSNPGAGIRTFHVTLSAPAGGLADGFVFRRSQATGTIRNIVASAGLPKVSLGDAAVAEGDEGTAKTLKFPLTLSGPTSQAMLVVVQVSNVNTKSGMKSSGADWGGGITKKIVVKPGQVTKFVGVPVFSDLESELDETLTVDIAGFLQLDKTPFAPGTEPAAVGDGRGIGTIISDE